jgi:DNA-binding LacI/PurR family transcriptional regulator
MARKRVTSRDVAKLAGVSRTTVSFVLNDVPHVQIPEETRRRVLEAAQHLGYHPDAAARSLATRQTQTIALVLYQSADRIVGDAFLSNVVRGLTEVAQQRGFRLLLHPFEETGKSEAYISLVLENRIDGLIVSGPRSDDEQLPKLRADGFPVVLLGQLDGADMHFVDVDNIAAAHRAVSHLIQLGHTRIGLVTNAPLEYTASAHRWRGYRQALAEASLPYDESIVRYGNFRAGSGYRAMEELLALPQPPTATFIASDEVATGALAALHERGLSVPQGMALVSFDDLPVARYLVPSLTTVHLPAYELGLQAADMLINLIQGEDVADRGVLLDTELIIRESCGSKACKGVLHEALDSDGGLRIVHPA